MTAAEALEQLKKAGLGDGVELFAGPKDAALLVTRERVKQLLRHLRDSRPFSCDLLLMITGTHMTEKRAPDKTTPDGVDVNGGVVKGTTVKGALLREAGFEVIWHLRSVAKHHLLAVKCRLPLADPRVDSVADLWPAADWHERETWDLLGITFTGHPNLRRILLPESWVGHPLRKDYVAPKEFEGINLEVDAPWPTP